MLNPLLPGIQKMCSTFGRYKNEFVKIVLWFPLVSFAADRDFKTK